MIGAYTAGRLSLDEVKKIYASIACVTRRGRSIEEASKLRRRGRRSGVWRPMVCFHGA